MAYTPPSLNIYQNFEQAMSGNTLPLYACVVAPHFGLHRYSVESERAALGAYDVANGNTFTSWPDKVAGGVVDVATAKIYAEDAFLQSLEAALTGGGDVGDGITVANGNKVRSDAYVFKTGNDHDRSAVFGTRDVQLGDPVKIAYTDSDAASIELDATVLNIVADVTAAAVGSTSAGASNATTATKVNTVTPGGSYSGTVTADATLYNGVKYGYKTETYVVTALADGTAGPVSVVSASGTDDVSSVTVTNGVAQALGARGATMTITGTLTSGQTWSILVTQAYTARVPSSGGTYTGAQDTTYLVTITSGGTVSSDAVRFSATTLEGGDGITDQLVAAAGGTYAIGAYGPTLAFTNTAYQYNKGDVFLVAVTTEKAEAYKTLTLSKSLPKCTLANDTIVITLGIRDTVELDVVNWTATSADITLVAGAEQTAWYTGAAKVYPVLEATLYASYRERIYETSQAIGSVTSITDVETLLGPSVPENPLSLGVYQACVGSAGTTVYYIGVESDDVGGYSLALDKLTETLEPYSVIPYDTSVEVRDLVEAFVDARSAADVAMFGIAWYGVDEARTAAFYTALSDGTSIMATVSGDVLMATGALFGVQGVRPGDSIRIKYRPDGHGNTIYDTLTVDQVLTDETIQLTASLSTPISIAIKMEVWRTATQSELAARIQAWATHHKNRRVRCIWSEDVSALGFENLSKFALACVLAGMRSALAPHQPMTNVNVEGIDLTYQVNFGSTLLNQMAGNGVWLVVKDVSGNIYTRHQVTTDNTDINRREDTITTNLDQICRDFRDGMKDLIGRGNVSDAMLEIIRSRVHSLANSITARPFPDLIGPQLQELKITKLYIDPVARDHVWLELEPTLPYPLNNLSVVFRVI